MRKFYTGIFTFIILACVVICTVIFNYVGTYSNDDWWAAFYWSKSFIFNLLSSDQGLIWSWHFEKFLMQIIPSVFHIHPLQNIFVPIVKGINFALCIFILSLFFKPSIKKIPNPLVVLINALIIFNIIFLVDIQIIVQINQHLKYVLNLILGGAIWYIWSNEFLNDKFLSRKNILRDCIYAIVLAFAGHLVNIPTIVFYNSLFIYEIFKSKRYLTNLKNLLPAYIPFAVIYIICGILYMNIPGLTYIRANRVPSESIIIYSFTHFADFSQKLFGNIFDYRYVCGLFVLTLIGLAVLIVKRKAIDKRYILISAAIFIANFAFQYSLLTCGTTYYDGKSYWFVSNEIKATFLFYLLLNCNVIYGCLFDSIKNIKYKITFILTSIIIINLIYPLNKAFDTVKLAYNGEIVQRTAIYKTNKIFRYYALKSDVIYIPIEYYSQVNVFNTQKVFDMLIRNLSKIYNINLEEKKYKLIDKKLINEAELFTEDEINNIDFKKLYDDNFILKMKEPKYEN